MPSINVKEIQMSKKLRKILFFQIISSSGLEIFFNFNFSIKNKIDLKIKRIEWREELEKELEILNFSKFSTSQRSRKAR
jgi:hypothetical protein